MQLIDELIMIKKTLSCNSFCESRSQAGQLPHPRDCLTSVPRGSTRRVPPNDCGSVLTWYPNASVMAWRGVALWNAHRARSCGGSRASSADTRRRRRWTEPSMARAWSSHDCSWASGVPVSALNVRLQSRRM